MNHEDRMQLAVTIAKMYYIDGYSQEYIAKHLCMSRSNVSRILRKCLEDGTVEISIRDPVTENPQLAKKLKKAFGLMDVIIVPSSSSQDRVHANIGERLSLYLMQILSDGMLLGVACGRALLSVGKKLDRRRDLKVDIVQLQGNTSSIASMDEGSGLISLYASKLNGVGFVLNAPLIVKSKYTRADLIRSNIVSRVFQLYQHLDVAVFEIEKPAFFANQRAPSEYLSRADILQLSEVGAIASACGYYYDKNGKPCSVGIKDRVIGIMPDQLKKVKYSIGISAGKNYLEETLSILKANLINVLVVDEKLAERLDEFC